MRRNVLLGSARATAGGLAMLFIPAACTGSRAARESTPAPAAAASAPSEADIMTYARLLAAADARRADTAIVDAAMASAWPILRAAATRAVGQLSLHARAPRLRALLSDPDTGTAAEAAFALGLLRDSSAVPRLAAALARGAPVSVEAAWALGEIGAAGAGDSIAAALAARPLPPIALPLLLASAKLRPVPAAAVFPYLAHPDSSVAWAAAYALARPRVPAGVRPLADLVLHRWHRVRAEVARGLARDAAGDSLAELALDRLRVLAADAHPHVRINALRALATFGPAARQALLAASRDHDPNVRIAAAQALSEAVGRDLPRWVWLWEADTGHTYRRSLLRSAGQVGVLLPALPAWRRSDDWRQRVAVVEALAASGSSDWLAAMVVPLTADPDPRVRSAALRAIRLSADSTGATIPGARDTLRRATGDPDVGVRAAALSGLAADPRPEELGLVVDALDRSVADAEADALVAALAWLDSLWRRDSAAIPDSIRRRLAALPPSADPIALRAAAALPLFAHWTASSATPRPLEWYENVVRQRVVRREPLVADILTERGTISVELHGQDAPLTVTNFVALADRGYYRGLRFHRVVPNFVAQDGDARGDGSGGPGYAIRDELNRRRYGRGVVGMALSGPDTGGSQYFITLSPQPHLDGRYTVFGAVVSGLEVLDAIVQEDRIEDVRIR